MLCDEGVAIKLLKVTKTQGKIWSKCLYAGKKYLKNVQKRLTRGRRCDILVTKQLHIKCAKVAKVR